MGVIGIRDGFGFELDTHRGRGDIRGDHFNFLNVENGNRLSGQYDLNNIEDNQDHDLLIQWDASEGMMQVYFDGALVGTADADDTIDLMGDTAGYMSIGAATGGRANEHRIDSLIFTGAFEDDLIF